MAQQNREEGAAYRNDTGRIGAMRNDSSWAPWTRSGGHVGHAGFLPPIGAHIHPTSTPPAFAAFDPALKKRDLDLIRIACHINARPVPTGVARSSCWRFYYFESPSGLANEVF
jgi:hypothetical protein